MQESLFNFTNPNTDYDIKKGECLTILKNTESNKFDLILTSPPYNVGKSYEAKITAQKL